VAASDQWGKLKVLSHLEPNSPTWTRLLWAAAAFVLVLSAAVTTSAFPCPPPPVLSPETINLFASDSIGACADDGSSCPTGNVTLHVVTAFEGVLSPCVTYSFHWQLGDGTDVTTSTRTLDHLFATPGFYINSVTVISLGGPPATTITRSLLITPSIPATSPFALVLLLFSLMLIGLAATR
jgi:hypothetical protein